MRRYVFIAAFGFCLNQVPLRSFATDTSIPSEQPLLLEVTLNNQITGQSVLFLQDSNSHLYASEDTLESWQLTPPKEEPILFMDKKYYDLSWYQGYKSSINTQELTIALTFPAQYFQSNTLNLYSQTLITPQKSPFGGYINYSLFSTGSTPGTPNSQNIPTQNSGIFSPTIFGPYGNLNSQFLVNQGPGASSNTQNNPLRLQTFYQIDFPNKMQSLIVGDSNTTAGTWGQSLAFGGITWQTNFGTQPGYNTFPLPTATGTAIIPSSIQLFANNVLLNNSKVAPGPFTINNVPAVTGAGSLSVVTTNLFGQEQVTTIPYYTSPQLLNPGLQNFSYQLGAVRENYGLNSNDYGSWVGVASDRFGVTNNLTVEGDLQTMSNQQNVGGSFSYLIDNAFLLNAAGVYGNNNTLGAGRLWQLGLSRQASDINLGANITYTSPNFLQIGSTPGQPSPVIQLQSFISKTFLQKYSVGLSYTEQNFRDQANTNFASLSLSTNLLEGIYLSLNFLSNIGGPNNKSASLSLNMNFGTVYNLGFNSNYSPAQNGSPANTQNTLTFSRTTPVGPGYGYSLQTTTNTGQADNFQGTFNLNTVYADGNVRLASFGNSNSYQATINGAMTYLNQVYFSPSIQGSFAAVNIPDLPNTKVYYNNQLVGSSNSKGNILVPNIAPYSINQISIDPEQLPLDTDIASTSVQVIPYNNQGLAVTFPITKLTAVLLNLKLPDGSFVPTGSNITLNDNNQKTYYVGYNGLCFIDNLAEGKNNLLVQWQQFKCTTTIDYKGEPNAKNPLPNLGTFVCTPVP